MYCERFFLLLSNRVSGKYIDSESVAEFAPTALLYISAMDRHPQFWSRKLPLFFGEGGGCFKQKIDTAQRKSGDCSLAVKKRGSSLKSQVYFCLDVEVLSWGG